MKSDDQDKEKHPTELKITEDGSHTLYSHRFEQTYHNPGGAVSESRHLFFETNNLTGALKTKDSIQILEVGLGTGLNLMLLLDYYQTLGSEAQINYHAVEAYPLDRKQVSAFNYKDFLNHPHLLDEVADLFSGLEKGKNTRKTSADITVDIFYGLFDDVQPGSFRADFVFQDAFSPEVNPDLWAGGVFKKLLALSAKDGVLTTYCAASKARGSMAWAGWYVAKTPGALGKREMTIASPDAVKLAPFDRMNEQYLATRYEQQDF